MSKSGCTSISKVLERKKEEMTGRFSRFQNPVIGHTPAWQFAIFPDICTTRKNWKGWGTEL